MSLNIDVISDVICPWCYIGKRRLEQAIAALETRQEIRVHWHPFQLNPAMQKEGISRQEYRTRKFGSWERSQELDAVVTAAGKSDGIDFGFCVRRAAKPGNAIGDKPVTHGIANSCRAIWIDLQDRDAVFANAGNHCVVEKATKTLNKSNRPATAQSNDWPITFLNRLLIVLSNCGKSRTVNGCVRLRRQTAALLSGRQQA